MVMLKRRSRNKSRIATRPDLPETVFHECKHASGLLDAAVGMHLLGQVIRDSWQMDEPSLARINAVKLKNCLLILTKEKTSRITGGE
jgi:hypothetical protein